MLRRASPRVDVRVCQRSAGSTGDESPVYCVAPDESGFVVREPSPLQRALSNSAGNSSPRVDVRAYPMFSSAEIRYRRAVPGHAVPRWRW